MNDLLEEAEEQWDRPGYDFDYHRRRVFLQLKEEVKRLHDVHGHYLFELDRANNLTKELEELKSNQALYWSDNKWNEIKRLEAENASIEIERIKERERAVLAEERLSVANRDLATSEKARKEESK